MQYSSPPFVLHALTISSSSLSSTIIVALVVRGRVCAAFCWCRFSLVLWVRRLRRPQARYLLAVCTKTFYRKQKFLRCCGLAPPAFTWALTSSARLNMPAIRILRRSQRNDDTPVKTPFLEDVGSSQRKLFHLPPVFNSNKYGALSVQLDTIRLNLVCIIDITKPRWTLFMK
jgi:hypothetical protein